MYGFIYITTNITTGRKYLGKKKFSQNSSNYLGSGKDLKKDIKIFGRNNFVRNDIDFADSAVTLKEKEAHYIKIFNCVESTEWYNIAHGFNTMGFSGKYHSDATKEKMRGSYKRILTEDGKRRIGEASKRDKRYLIAAEARKDKIGSKHHRSIPVTIDGITYESINIATKALSEKYSSYRVYQIALSQREPTN